MGNGVPTEAGRSKTHLSAYNKTLVIGKPERGQEMEDFQEGGLWLECSR